MSAYRFKFGYTFIFAVFLISFSACQTKLNPDISAVDQLITSEIEAENIPGAVIQIKQGERILLSKAYGYAFKYNFDLTPAVNPQKMTPRHLFDLASLTKVLATTFGVMLLADQQKITIDDKVGKYLPAFDTGKKSNITIRHLLTHTAGLYQWKPLYYNASNPSERFRYIAQLPLAFEVGKARHYSDLGFMLLGDLISKVSGLPFQKYLAEQLYKPLKLEHATFNPLQNGFKPEDIAATSHGNPFEKRMVYDDEFGYSVEVEPDSWDGWRNYTLQGEVNDGNSFYANQGIAGHAGLFATVGDIQKLVDLLLQKGRWNGKQIISPKIVARFLTRDQFGNGLGWAMDEKIISARGTPEGTFGHTGFTGTSIVVIPKHRLSIILLTNRQHVGLQNSGYYYDLGPLRQHIVDAVLKYDWVFTGKT